MKFLRFNLNYLLHSFTLHLALWPPLWLHSDIMFELTFDLFLVFSIFLFAIDANISHQSASAVVWALLLQAFLASDHVPILHRAYSLELYGANCTFKLYEYILTYKYFWQHSWVFHIMNISKPTCWNFNIITLVTVYYTKM